MNTQGSAAPTRELGHPGAPLAPVPFSSPVSADRDGSWLTLPRSELCRGFYSRRNELQSFDGVQIWGALWFGVTGSRSLRALLQR